jgi:hypothetical protein
MIGSPFLEIDYYGSRRVIFESALHCAKRFVPDEVRGSLPHKETQASRPYAKSDDICDIDDTKFRLRKKFSPQKA